MPGTVESLGRSSSMVWSTESRRSSRGFSRTNMKPWLPLPTNAPRLCTLGSLATMSTTARWCFAIDSNEMSSPAIVTPKMKPLSWLGMKPVGMAKNR